MHDDFSAILSQNNVWQYICICNIRKLKIKLDIMSTTNNKNEKKEQEETMQTEATVEQQGAENQECKTEETVDWEKKFNDLNDSHLRLMADFDNYRKKTLKERADLIKFGGENIFKDMLPIIDDFERALANMPDEDNPLKEGVELIHSKFVNFLNQNGVKEIETKDAVFDTDFHEAVTLFPTSDESMKGKIIDCTQKGYTYHEKVIRFAKVVVGQ